MLFLIQVLMSIIDPIGLVGYITSGILFKRLRYALMSCTVWAVLMEVFVLLLNSDYSGHLFFARIIGSIIATSIVFGIARFLRS